MPALWTFRARPCRANGAGSGGGLLLGLGAVARERAAANALTQLRKADTDSRRRSRQQARFREPGQRIDLEAPEAAVLVHAEIDAAVNVELQRAVHAQRQPLDLLGLVRREIGRKNFVGAAGLIFRGVVEDWPGVGDDLADGERLSVEHTDGELAAVDVALEHDLRVEAARELERSVELRRRANQRE